MRAFSVVVVVFYFILFFFSSNSVINFEVNWHLFTVEWVVEERITARAHTHRETQDFFLLDEEKKST